MGRGRSGFLVSSIRKAERGNGGYSYIVREPPFTGASNKASSFSPEEIEALKSIPKEQIGRVLFKSQRTLVSGNCVSCGTTINSSRTKPLLGLSNKWYITGSFGFVTTFSML